MRMANETARGVPRPEREDGALQVKKPLPGESSVLAVDPGTTLYLDFPLDQVEAVLEDGALILTFESGGQVVLQNFEEALPSSAVILADGTEIEGARVLETLQPGAGEPAAGAAPPSGGIGEYDDDLGDLIPGIDRLGTLDPRDFGGSFEEPVGGTRPFEGLEGDADEPADLVALNFEIEMGFNPDEVGNILYFTEDGVRVPSKGGDVLPDDTFPGDVEVIQFQVDGLTDLLPSGEDPVVLAAGARFRLAPDGSFDLAVSSTETVTDYAGETLGQGDSRVLDIGERFEYATLHFTDVDRMDALTLQWTDGEGNQTIRPLSGRTLERTGEYELYDPEGIESVSLTGVSGEVTLGILELEDLNNLSPDPITVSYTIQDTGSGETSSADLLITFTPEVIQTGQASSGVVASSMGSASFQLMAPTLSSVDFSFSSEDITTQAMLDSVACDQAVA